MRTTSPPTPPPPFRLYPAQVPLSAGDGWTLDAGRDLGRAYEGARAAGKRVRCVVVINPHNPLGSVLKEKTLREILRFCADRRLHVILDEVYGLSVFGRGKKEEEEGEEEEDEEEEEFVSVLSYSKDVLPDPERTHFVWSMSKDFALSGFRFGVIHSYWWVLAGSGAAGRMEVGSEK